MKQSHESNKPEEAVWAENRTTPETGHVVHGAQVGCGLHVVLLPILFFASSMFATSMPRFEGYFGYVVVYVGVIQLIYIGPALLWARRKNSPKGFQKGLVLAAVALFLLNAGCLGMFFYG